MSLNLGKEKVHFNVARLKKQGNKFEVVIDPDLAIKFRNHPDSVDVRDVLKSEHIFSDAQKGLLASKKLIEDLFGKDVDDLEVARRILLEGEIDLTSEYREKLLEMKRNRIAEIISRNAVDPRTKLPHPKQRILSAMEEAKVKVDMFKNAEDQVKDVVKKIETIIPISMSKAEFEVKVPPAYTGKVYPIISKLARKKSESWQSDGSLVVDVEVSAALELDFIDKLNKVTHGEVIITKKKEV